MMRILVYGAGVIGCELAHVLKEGGNDVTLLTRGAWEELRKEKADISADISENASAGTSMNASMPIWDSLRKNMPK